MKRIIFFSVNTGSIVVDPFSNIFINATHMLACPLKRSLSLSIKFVSNRFFGVDLLSVLRNFSREVDDFVTDYKNNTLVTLAD